MVAPCPSKAGAVATCFAMCAVYVGVLYVDYDRSKSRDHPDVILQRFVRTMAVSLLSPAALILSSVHANPNAGGATPHCARDMDAPISAWLGLESSWVTITGTLAALALTTILFLGPVVMVWHEGWREFATDRCSYSLRTARTLLLVRAPPRQLSPWLGASCLVERCLAGIDHADRGRWCAQGPLCEEVVFRSVMCPLLFASGLDEGLCVLISAIVFGSAHVHHRFDMSSTWVTVLVMFTYTSLFGAYSSYLFMRTGQLLPPFAAHSLCNFLGLPDFGGVARHPRAQLIGCCFVAGLATFVITVILDGIYRPPLFASRLWHEHSVAH